MGPLQLLWIGRGWRGTGGEERERGGHCGGDRCLQSMEPHLALSTPSAIPCSTSGPAMIPLGLSAVFYFSYLFN